MWLSPRAMMCSGRANLSLRWSRNLVQRGANFVVPVDAEPKRKADGLADLLRLADLADLRDNLTHRPADVAGAAGDRRPAP